MAIYHPEMASEFQSQVDPNHDLINNIGEMAVSSLPQIIYFNAKAGHYELLACALTGEKGNEIFATFFGRDAGETQNGVENAQKLGAPIQEEVQKFREATINLDRYQVKEDNSRLGRTKGAILHEIRTGEDVETFRKAGWYYNEAEDRVESADVADATHWWVINMTNIIKEEPWILQKKRESLLLAADYILTNSAEHKGLAGFTNDIGVIEEGQIVQRLTDENGNLRRVVNGITSRTWKDSWDGLLYNNRRVPEAGKRVDLQEVSALKYTAVMQLADRLSEEAQSLQQNELTWNLITSGASCPNYKI